DYTDSSRSAMTALDEESKSGDRKPVHKYSLADYGLTEDQVRAEFEL
ncbi:sulfotransferase, partial [Nocardia tengchongensis]